MASPPPPPPPAPPSGARLACAKRASSTGSPPTATAMCAGATEPGSGDHCSRASTWVSGASGSSPACLMTCATSG
eukprot:CAMPEP_0202858338 /NCGR_PEP_ID=MMETSP1391-20130828/915_1 /ASSEMBLY_ACC=CAM_ASM_000867 /TAXON_ID=1034604 /ORGANISM="Chlamydomonas leiostraca, Strain SAG 11-49" /LENGTH=74 /DNA_ID=CAMNT_0049537249 /DNA_START=1510 /DNA_END=1731 /DNA_ORIENTATION=+